MSRSGYSDECEHVELYRQAVRRATEGCYGQHFLKKLLVALDAMPVKRLITDTIQDKYGDVCALGALDPTIQEYDAEYLAPRFGIARALAAEIVYMNDENGDWRYEEGESPERRWKRMRAWVASQILPEEA